MKKGFRIESGFGKFTLIATIIFALGCNKDPIVSQHSDETVKTKSIDIAIGSSNSLQSFVDASLDQAGLDTVSLQKWLVLSNGFIIYKTNHYSTDECLTLDFVYEDLNHDMYQRRLEISSLSEIRLTDGAGRAKFEYGYELVSENSLLYHAQTQIDTLLFEVQRINDSIQLTVDVNQNSYATGFSNVSELQMAMRLFAEGHDRSLDNNMGSYEQDITQRYENLMTPILGAVSLNRNNDVDAAMYLFSDPGFLHWFKSNGDIPLAKCDDCWCEVAELIATVSCPFIEAGWPAIICVPAAGLTAACTLKTWIECLF